MADESPRATTDQQRILLVTGLSGAGKSTALQVLEDMGWETHDNFPLRLLQGLFSGEAAQPAPIAIGVDSRTRGFDSADIAARCHELSARSDLDFSMLFLDCADREIERRYNETRRPHPLSRAQPVEHGIRAERVLLEPLREIADTVIDTTGFATNQLQQVVREQFAESAQREMTITISSFGFSRGVPPLADLMFDMRFIDNPHWVATLRDKTGLDPEVADYIEQTPQFAPAFGHIAALLRDLVPRYAAQGRSYLNIAFGCTGGRHRSVYSAQAAARVLREAGFSPTVIHRNLGGRAADAPPTT